MNYYLYKVSFWIVLLAMPLAECCLESRAAEGEEQLLLLHDGGRICGVVPQIGGRVVLYRMDAGENVLDARPALWKDTPPLDLKSTDWKQYYGESVWSGPQIDWWTMREPYPPRVERQGTWPPDPAWELAPFTVMEKTAARVVMRSPISAFTGLQLTKTIELLPAGSLRFQARAVNRGDRMVTRDLWLIHRVLPTARCFLPLKSAAGDAGFNKTALLQKIEGLTVFELSPGKPPAEGISGKMTGVPSEGWMTVAMSGAFFTVRFPVIDESKIAPGHAPVEVFMSSAPRLLCEMEHHGEIRTLKPGESMENEELWQIVPYSGSDSPVAQAHFLRVEMEANR